MKRLFLVVPSLLALGGSAFAQAPEPAPPIAAPTEPAPTEPAPVVAPPPVVEPAKPAKAEEPRRFAIGKESPGAYLQLGLNLQVWGIYDHSKTATGDVTIANPAATWRTRRLEISGSGEIVPKLVKYRFMIDPARVRDFLGTTTVQGTTGTPVTVTTGSGAVSILQDMWLTLVTDYADFSFGQTKNMISWDGFNSAAKLILPDRSFATQQVGGIRDVGVRIEKTFKMFMYAVALFNGSGQNNLDANNQKDVSGRLEIYPIPGLTIAGAFYDSIGYRTKRGTKDRWEGDLRYEGGPFLFQAEFIEDRDILADNGVALKSRGGYAAVAYMLKGLIAGHDLQPVVRVGYFDPNADVNLDPTAGAPAQPFFGANANTNNDERMDFEVGLNYYLRGHEAKFQLAYDRQQYDNSSVKPAVDEVILAGQVWF
jgi:hypothetical protein